MRVLLVGSGGREHALAWKIAQSPLLTELLIAPGNPGAAQHGRTLPIAADAVAALVAAAQREGVDLAVIGPEAPLAAGLSDALRAAGIAVFGPSQAAAQIESSKAFCKALMQQAGVPTAQAHVFDDAETAVAFVRDRGQPWVVKADGLAAGKGVVVAESVDATIDAIKQLSHTAAGARLLLEERLSGPEVSLIALCDGTRLLALPLAQDHKRLLDGDQGPNTGGMGTFAPSTLIAPSAVDALLAECVQPVVDALAAQNTPFVGALFAGLILTPAGPRVLEFNARFGDPETQVILPLLAGDLLAALRDCAHGQLRAEALGVRAGAAVCVVLAAAGYPDAPHTGDQIEIDLLNNAETLVFHAGTARHTGALVTAGGRVLGVTGLGENLAAARARAYAGVAQVRFAGAQHRSDIGGER